MNDCHLQPVSGVQALTRLRKSLNAVESLPRSPCPHGVSPADQTRVTIAGNHRLIYELNPDTAGHNTPGDAIIPPILGPGSRL